MNKIALLTFIFGLWMTFCNVNAQSDPRFWQFASAPPLGWNSWDIFGTTVTEQKIKEQMPRVWNMISICRKMVI